MEKQRTPWTWLPILLSLCCVLGCGSAISKSSYDKIQGGMSLAEVETILGKGKPSEKGGDMSKVKPLTLSEKAKESMKSEGGEMTSIWMQWGSGQRYIMVMFVNGGAMMKQQEGL